MQLKFMKRLLTLVLFASIGLHAESMHESIFYDYEGIHFESHLIYNSDYGPNQPVLLMVPNWMGPTENAFKKARKLADEGFAVFVTDMYGLDVRPTNTQESAKAAGFVRADRPMMRARAQKAVSVIESLADEYPLNPNKVLAIGFCFGGGTVLELARSGESRVRGVVAFHGNLDTPNPADAYDIKIPVLVLHGANDPYVPKEQIDGFFEEMRVAGVDFQFIAFGGAVHSFTNPEADSDGARYHERSAQRAFEMLSDFAAELL